MPRLALTGCRSKGILGYLKALGVLHSVERRPAATALGRWREGVFEISSDLEQADLIAYFLEEYAPAPVVSPWNGGSGFFPKDNKAGIDAIAESQSERLVEYRNSISASREALAQFGLAEKPDQAEKAKLLRCLRSTLPDSALDWIDAAAVLRGSEVSYPPLLGTGGNDGRFDFSANYIRCVASCLLSGDVELSRERVESALLGTEARLEPKLSLGHLSRDSSPNNSPFGEADSLGNPWDLILAVEGCLLISAGAARRHDTALSSMLVAPFTAFASGTGYGSAIPGEKGRAEVWMPEWESWASALEIRTLAREARARVTGTGSRHATTGLDFVRAAGEMGVARGISGFQRFAILERSGQSQLAVSAGRIEVIPRPGAEALKSIDTWLTRSLRVIDREKAPRSLAIAGRLLEDAVFRFALKGDSLSAQGALGAIGEFEHHAAVSRREADWLTPLDKAPALPWLRAADDSSHEFAIAAALASLRESRTKRENSEPAAKDPHPALRDYLHGTKRAGLKSAFDSERRYRVPGHTLIQILSEAHRRRFVSGAAPFSDGGAVGLSSLRLFAAGLLDEDRILSLLYGLSLLDYRTPTGDKRRSRLDNEYRAAARSRSAIPLPVTESMLLAWQDPGEGEGDPRLLRATQVRRERESAKKHLGARRSWPVLMRSHKPDQIVREAILRLQMALLPPAVDADSLIGSIPPDPDWSLRQSCALLMRLRNRDLAVLVDSYIKAKEPTNGDD